MHVEAGWILGGRVLYLELWGELRASTLRQVMGYITYALQTEAPGTSTHIVLDASGVSSLAPDLVAAAGPRVPAGLDAASLRFISPEAGHRRQLQAVLERQWGQLWGVHSGLDEAIEVLRLLDPALPDPYMEFEAAPLMS